MKYYLIAGEASGDLHGSNLMKGLYAQDPGADIRFWGGSLMDAVYREHQDGDGWVQDYRDGAVMGYLAVLLKGFSIWKKLRSCKEDIGSWKPDVVILIDYPGFNFKVAEYAHGAGFKVFYYIAPKIWASREGRIRKLKAWVDRLYIIFPFEETYFQDKGVSCTYRGNPLVDAVDASPAMQETREAFLARTGLPDAPWIALLAGSRKMEIGSMMPTYMQWADAWHQGHPETHFVVAAAPSRSLADYAPYLGERPYVHVVFGETYGVLRHAGAAVVNSGTASLEAALIGTPQVVTYRVDAVSGFIMRRLIKVPYVSLANLILDRAACRELLQENFTVERLMAEMTRLQEDKTCREDMLEAYREIRRRLGGSGASAAVAAAMIQDLTVSTRCTE